MPDTPALLTGPPTSAAQASQPQGFDLDGARKAGYGDDEILQHLADTHRFDLSGALKAGYSKDELLSHLAGPPSIAPRDTRGRVFSGETTGSVPGDLLSGFGASGISIPVGGYSLIRKIPGMDSLLPPPSADLLDLATPPNTVAGKVGDLAGDALSFMLPGPAEEKILSKIGATSRLGKAAARATVDAASAGTVEGVKSGGDLNRTLAVAGGAGLMGGATEGLGEPIIHSLTDLWGKATGAGGEAIRTAATQASKDFTDAMRNRKTENQIVEQLNDAVHDVMTKRGNDYRQAMSALDQTIALDPKPMRQALTDQLAAFKVNPFGKGKFAGSPVVNPTDQDTILRAVSDVSRWRDFSPAGMDTLKQRLTQYADSASPRVQPFFYRIADAANQEMKTKVPGYADLTKDYSDATELLQTVRKELSANKPNPGETMRKLSYALNQNNAFRQVLLESLDQAAGSDLKNTIAGYSLRTPMPRGLAGVLAGGLTTYFHNPALLGGLALGSPRVAGETMALLAALRRSRFGDVSLKGVVPAAVNQLTAPPANLTPPPQ